MQTRDFRMERFALRLLAVISAALALLFLVQFAADTALSGPIVGGLEITPAATRALASTVSRAFNNLMTMVLAFIALAVPITANMYTPRLIEIFVRDRVNLVVLLFYALMGANAVFVQALGLDQWSPYVMYWLLAVSGAVGFVILIP